MIEIILKNQSTIYHLLNENKRKFIFQALFRKRFLTHMREWKFIIEKLIEFEKLIKMRLNKFENKYLSIKDLIKIIIAKIMNQKNNIISL